MSRFLMMIGVVAVTLAACGPEPGAVATRAVQGVSSGDLNSYRASRGLSGLRYSRQLERAAARHANDMARNNFKSHRGSDGSNVADRVRGAGYKWCHVAENITWGRPTYAKAIAAWDASPAHRKNLLGRTARDYGVAQSEGGLWVMVFAAPC